MIGPLWVDWDTSLLKGAVEGPTGWEAWVVVNAEVLGGISNWDDKRNDDSSSFETCGWLSPLVFTIKFGVDARIITSTVVSARARRVYDILFFNEY